MATKKCSKCGKRRSLREFHTGSAKCKLCCSDDRRQRYWSRVIEEKGLAEAKRLMERSHRRKEAKAGGLRICPKCDLPKRESDFYSRSMAYCKPCYNSYVVAHRKSSPEWIAKVKKWHRNHELRHRYGMEPDVYVALLKKQGGVCAICKTRPKTKGRPVALAVDHDHKDGRVRGLLCRQCNTALGVLGDRAESSIFKRAMRYLGAHSE